MAITNRKRRIMLGAAAPKQGGGGTGLQTLTLSAMSFTQDMLPGTKVADIGGKTDGSVIELVGGNGRLTRNSAASAIHKGLVGPAAGTFDITLREIHPTLGTKDTTFTMTVTALSALDPLSASQSAALIASLRKVVPSYAGNCIQVRHSGNALVAPGFSGNDINAAALQGVGDGVTFRVTIWYDQLGVRNLTTASGPYLTFKNNFATLVTVPTPTNGGTGYTVGDVLTLSGGVLAETGGIAAQLTVAAVSSGVVTAVTVSRAGKYRYSPSGTNSLAAGVTGGTGTGATFPVSLTADAGNTYTAANCYVDYAATGGTSLVTTDTFLNVGGTNNIAAFVVFSKNGYGSASSPLPRPGTANTASGVTCLLGYGTLAGGKLLTSCSNLGVGQADAAGFGINRDSLGRSTAPYDLPEWMAIDETTPDAAGGFMNVWFNQRGATVSGGGDTRLHYSGREHSVAAATGQRLVLGANGAAATPHNGGIKEVVLFNPTTALTDTECQRIAIWQNQWSGVTQATTWGNRYFIIYTGQSNSNGHLDKSSSGDGVTDTTRSAERRFRPMLATSMGVPEERILFGSAGITAVGGTAMMRRKASGDADNLVYWWDEDANSGAGGPGSLMLYKQILQPSVTTGGTGYTVGDVLTVVGGTGTPTVLVVSEVAAGVITKVTVQNAGRYSVAPATTSGVTGGTGTGATFGTSVNGGLLAYLDTLKGLRYKRIVIHHAQGEEDATGNLTDARITQWGQQSYQFLDYVRNYVNQPEAAIVVQPLARYEFAPDAAQRLRVNKMRRLQSSYLGVQPNVFTAPDTGHNARGTAGNFGAHFGTMASGGFDPTTGTLEDGYQRVAWQNAKAAAHAVHMVQGKDLAVADNWRGPEILTAKKTAANKIFYPVSYPYGCGGSDFSTVSGQYAGFRVNVGGTDYFATSGEKKTVGGQAGVEMTFGVADVPIGSNTAYEANYASGDTQGTNVRNQLLDNNTELNMPAASSQVLAVA